MATPFTLLRLTTYILCVIMLGECLMRSDCVLPPPVAMQPPPRGEARKDKLLSVYPTM